MEQSFQIYMILQHFLVTGIDDYMLMLLEMEVMVSLIKEDIMVVEMDMIQVPVPHWAVVEQHMWQFHQVYYLHYQIINLQF